MGRVDFDTPLKMLDGTETSLRAFEGQVLLIVNTASKCGFTPQYAALEELYQQYREDGLVVLGFPCNQFRRQEPGTAQEIQRFCQLNYGVSFPIHEKVDVNGSTAHPLFEQLKRARRGLLGTKRIKWNFTKFLVGRDGAVLARWAPSTEPTAVVGDIRRALGVGTA